MAGRIVAEAILLYKESDSSVAFGHIFPSHALDYLDEEMIHQAFTRSKADFAYIDRKSMKAQKRERLVLSEAEKIEKKFSTERERAIGITEGPLFGRLARGDSVMLDGKTINPEMVYEINIRAIKLNYEKAIEE